MWLEPCERPFVREPSRAVPEICQRPSARQNLRSSFWQDGCGKSDPSLGGAHDLQRKLCTSWMQISQQEWQDHLDTVQFSGKQGRKKLHDDFHTSEHCRNMPALGKKVMGFGARLLFPAYANSARLCNADTASRLLVQETQIPSCNSV